MNSRIIRFSALIICFILLSSCLSVTTGLVHRSNGTGQLILDYRLNKNALGIQKDSLGTGNLIPLPVKQSDFEDSAALVEGISIEGYQEREDSDYVYIEAELEYDSLNDLSAFLGIPVVYSESGNSEQLSITFYKPGSGMSPDTLAIIESVFADDVLRFEFSLPGNVSSSSHGSVDGREILFETALADIYRGDGFVWTIEW